MIKIVDYKAGNAPSVMHAVNCFGRGGLRGARRIWTLPLAPAAIEAMR